MSKTGLSNFLGNCGTVYVLCSDHSLVCEFTVHVCVYIHTHVHAHVHTHTHTHAHTYTHAHTHTHTHTHTYARVLMHSRSRLKAKVNPMYCTYSLPWSCMQYRIASEIFLAPYAIIEQLFNLQIWQGISDFLANY